MVELNLMQKSEVADNTGFLTVGQLLKKARKVLDWDVARVADRLNMPETYIRFIEKDEFSRLPSATFARGYVKAYANCMEMPVEEIMGTYNKQTGKIVGDSVVKKTFITKKEAEASDPIMRWASGSVVAVFLALSMLWWQNQSDDNEMISPATETVTIETADGNEIVESLSSDFEHSEFIISESNSKSALN